MFYESCYDDWKCDNSDLFDSQKTLIESDLEKIFSICEEITEWTGYLKSKIECEIDDNAYSSVEEIEFCVEKILKAIEL